MLAALAAAVLPCATGLAAESPKRPNVVLILADDLGYGDPRCYNAQSKVPTPRMDRLAAEGMRFSDAHTPASVCTPTRYGLLTGRYPWRSRLKSGVLNGYSPALVEPGRATLATLLHDAGYRTGCVGKWHLGFGTEERVDYGKPLVPGPNAVGFDEAFVLPASLDMPPYVFVEDDHPTLAPSETIAASGMRRHGGRGFWRKGAIAPGFRHIDTLPTLADRAVQFIERQDASTPFFLYVPFTGPHTPWMPLDAFRGKSGAGYYGDFVAQVDATLGRLLDALAERKLADNTLLIFTSDNGAHWLPNDIQEWGHRANADWRGQKSDLWEGGHRVPLIVRYPGVVNAGTHSDQLVCLTDVLATVAEIVARPLNVDMGEDSYSFAGVLRRAPASGHGAKRSSTSRAMEPWQSARVAGSWRRSWARTASARRRTSSRSPAARAASCTTWSTIRRRRATCGSRGPRSSSA